MFHCAGLGNVIRTSSRRTREVSYFAPLVRGTPTRWYRLYPHLRQGDESTEMYGGPWRGILARLAAVRSFGAT